jgi:hypothetical protein
MGDAATGLRSEGAHPILRALHALSKWHRSATKKSKSQLEALFQSVALEPVLTRSYLEGTLIGATATAGPTETELAQGSREEISCAISSKSASGT